VFVLLVWWFVWEILFWGGDSFLGAGKEGQGGVRGFWIFGLLGQTLTWFGKKFTQNDEFSIFGDDGKSECKIAKDYAERDAQKLFDDAFPGMYEFGEGEGESGCFNSGSVLSASLAVAAFALVAAW
jgi:hypothetical protein